MKQLLLVFTFSILGFVASAQRDGGPNNNCINCGGTERAQLLIYPNPVTEFIGVNDDNDLVRRLDIFNLMGRQIKSITITKGERYSVSELANGVYFVRMIDKNERVITTQRVNKR
jgi:hypothetical protein